LSLPGVAIVTAVVGASTFLNVAFGAIGCCERLHDLDPGLVGYFVAVIAEREAARVTRVARSFVECILNCVRSWWVCRAGLLEFVAVGAVRRSW
jgi:hypothetical protein